MSSELLDRKTFFENHQIESLSLEAAISIKGITRKIYRKYGNFQDFLNQKGLLLPINRDIVMLQIPSGSSFFILPSDAGNKISMNIQGSGSKIIAAAAFNAVNNIAVHRRAGSMEDGPERQLGVDSWLKFLNEVLSGVDKPSI